MIADEGCWERGCACHDSRDSPGVELVRKREWVGLTDEDWAKVADMPDTFDQGVAWAQARLKEKNDY